MIRRAVLAVLLVLMAGCWNGNGVTTINLGSVSLGQQLIDLKTAYEQGAMNEEEYQRLRSAIVSLDRALVQDTDASQ